METSFIHPLRSPSVASERQTPSPRQNSRSRRRGAESSESRSPSELLKEIGIAGAEVVKVLKARGWEVCEPKGLEEHKRYYLPGGKAKGEEAKRGEDFVVGEGELYAYVLEKGGARYLIPNADQLLNRSTRRSSSREKSAPRKTEAVAGDSRRDRATQKRPVVFESGEDTDLIEHFSDERSSATSPQHRKKRRRKQATTEQAPSSDQPQSGNVIIVDDNNETDSATSRCPSTNNQQVAAESTRNMRTPVEQYEAALKARGSRAQLLKDLDLNLLQKLLTAKQS